MKLHVTILLGGLAVATAACDNEPAKGKAQATVAASGAAQAPAAPPANAVAHAFSESGSSVEFTGAKVTGKHDGKFNKFRGTVHVVDNDPTKSSVTAEIDTDSVTSDDEKLTGHLKSPDFFDTAKFPKAKFTSTSIKAGGDKGASHTVTGNLELHGVTKQISFPATIKMGAGSVDVEAEFAINRKDFGIVYPGKPDDLIKDDVLMKLKLSAKKG